MLQKNPRNEACRRQEVAVRLEHKQTAGEHNTTKSAGSKAADLLWVMSKTQNVCDVYLFSWWCSVCWENMQCKLKSVRTLNHTTDGGKLEPQPAPGRSAVHQLARTRRHWAERTMKEQMLSILLLKTKQQLLLDLKFNKKKKPSKF